MLDPQLTAAKWYVGELAGEDLAAVACEALKVGFDGKYWPLGGSNESFPQRHRRSS